MSLSHQPRSPHRAAVQGFTIVEMAVVLVIIGVILGAVMIGRDAQRNAEYIRVRQTFVNQWVVAYNSYVQRTGFPVGDDRAAPRLMVNGAQFALNATTGTSSGADMSAAAEPNAICQLQAGPNMKRAKEATPSLRTLMLEAGIELPQGRGVGHEDRYVYLDTNGNPQELQVCFQWNKPGTRSGTGNVMVITGLTPDLARSLAYAIKGNADASSGSFRQEGVLTGAATALDWIGVNTNGISAANGGIAGQNDRELQVATVVAHYKMNQ